MFDALLCDRNVFGLEIERWPHSYKDDFYSREL